MHLWHALAILFAMAFTVYTRGLYAQFVHMHCFPLLLEMSLFSSVTYVVVGVVLREGKVLMMQEAKPSCRGRWYLPAGRMEAGETVEVSGALGPAKQYL